MYGVIQQKGWRKPNISLAIVVINLLILIQCIGIIEQFYLPGLAPVNYCIKSDASSNCKSNVTLYVNRLNTEESIIPCEYHHFDFCIGNENNLPVENLFQVVFGERIRPGPYKINFLEDI